MDQEPDVIRHQIEETRSALTEKLETLEDQVKDTVESAKSTVEETFATVKHTVEDTVQTVKQTFDLNYQVDRHPWGMLGGSVLAGFIVGSLLHRPSRYMAGSPGVPVNGNGYGGGERTFMGHTASLASPSVPARPGFLSRFLHQFDSELEEVKEVAIGTAVGLLRDVIKQSVPQLAAHVEEIMDSATRKMGGKPIQEPLMGGDRTGARAHA